MWNFYDKSDMMYGFNSKKYHHMYHVLGSDELQARWRWVTHQKLWFLYISKVLGHFS